MLKRQRPFHIFVSDQIAVASHIYIKRRLKGWEVTRGKFIYSWEQRRRGDVFNLEVISDKSFRSV